MFEMHNHTALSQLWCPRFDAQCFVLSQPVLELLRQFGLAFNLPFLQEAQESVPYLLSLFATSVLGTVLLWLALERVARHMFTSFAAVPYAKRMYVVANLCKSAVLGLQVCSLSWWYYCWLHYRCELDPVLKLLHLPSPGPCDFDATPGQTLASKIASTIYVTTDAAALVIVPKLPTTTVIHHWSTTIFLFFLLFTKSHTYEVGRKLMFYGFCSTLAYLVNSFLALRVVDPRAPFLKPLAIVSALIYALCCAFNWSVHLVWVVDTVVHGALSIPIVIYLLLVMNLVRDDLILMKWLITFDPEENASKAARALAEKAQERNKTQKETVMVEKIKKED